VGEQIFGAEGRNVKVLWIRWKNTTEGSMNKLNVLKLKFIFF